MCCTVGQQGHGRGVTGVNINNSPIWHLRPVKPAKQEQVKEGLPVMQSSMQRPPFIQGRRCGHTDAVEVGQHNRCQRFNFTNKHQAKES